MGCQAELGGAVVAEDSSRLNVHRSTFADNNASYGGVVLARGLSRVSMNECQFEGNTADKRGGVLQAQDSTQVRWYQLQMLQLCYVDDPDALLCGCTLL